MSLATGPAMAPVSPDQAPQPELSRPNPSLDRMFKWFTLEVGVLIGSLLTVVVGILTAVVFMWRRTGFGPLVGPLTNNEMTRIIAPGLVCGTLGVETIFSSFFLSILGYVKKA